MTCRLERVLVSGDLGVERIRLRGDFALDLRRVEASPGERAAEMVPLVPVFLPAPDELPRFMREGQTGSAPCRSLSHAGDPADMRLVSSDPACRDILHDRIGSRCTEGNIMELRHAQHVAHRVAEPVGMVALEEIGFADCQRPDGAQRNVEIVSLGHRAIAPDREVAIRRAEAEIELCSQGHAAELYISGLAAKARTATGLAQEVVRSRLARG